jgi:hypothetical protein
MDINYKINKHSENITLNNVKYEIRLLRKNLPYVIEFDRKTKDFYLLDRDYCYMGYENIKRLTIIEPDLDRTQKDYGYERIYLYNDGCQPWHGKKFMLDYINKYMNEKTKLNKCKTDNLIQIFDWFDI